MLTFVLICTGLGLVAGFLAGLLGIGGGLVIVPALVWLLPILGVANEYLMPLAIGTSFATIVITSFSSAQRHHRFGNVDWSIVKILTPSLMISVFIFGQFVSSIPKAISAKFFACIVLYLAARMFLSAKNKSKNKELTTIKCIAGGSAIGGISSFAGIGGGGFIVPFLNAHGIDMRKAIGSSAFCGAMLGLAGCISFIVSGWNVENLPKYSLGFVYLPAVLSITITSFFTSKLGATLTTKVPVVTLKKGFALFLCIVAIEMFLAS